MQSGVSPPTRCYPKATTDGFTLDFQRSYKHSLSSPQEFDDVSVCSAEMSRQQGQNQGLGEFLSTLGKLPLNYVSYSCKLPEG